MNKRTFNPAINKIAKRLWISHADSGEMVGEYEEQGRYWKEEAKKFIKIIRKEYCGDIRPKRKVLCQLPKGHKGSCQAVIFWEKEKMKGGIKNNGEKPSTRETRRRKSKSLRSRRRQGRS